MYWHVIEKVPDTAPLVIPRSKQALDDRSPRCFSWRGTRLEQFAIVRLVLSITASIRAETEDRTFLTLVPCRWTLKNISSFVASNLRSPLLIFLSRDLEVPRIYTRDAPKRVFFAERSRIKFM